MPNAARPLLLAAAVAALAACQQDRSDQNIAIDNNVANADIEALPPDESSAAPANELDNGAANADATNANAAGNGY